MRWRPTCTTQSSHRRQANSNKSQTVINANIGRKDNLVIKANVVGSGRNTPANADHAHGEKEANRVGETNGVRNGSNTKSGADHARVKGGADAMSAAGETIAAPEGRAHEKTGPGKVVKRMSTIEKDSESATEAARKTGKMTEEERHTLQRHQQC